MAKVKIEDAIRNYCRAVVDKPNKEVKLPKREKDYEEVEFEISGRSGNTIRNVSVTYPIGTTDEEIQKDFDEWYKREMTEIEGYWRRF